MRSRLPGEPAQPPAGQAHVATVSFLGARLAPSAGFWLALAGGTALARVAQRQSARQGFGAGIAAMLEAVAIMGPTRFGVPLTQALSAPIIGRLHTRGASRLLQVLVCGVIRLVHNAATTAFFIWIITGGLDAYAGTYDAVGRRFGVELGAAGTLAVTAVGLVAWAAFASAVQVAVYLRGLRRWPEEGFSSVGRGHAEAAGPAGSRTPPPSAGPPDRAPAGRLDPRLVALAAAIAFGLLVSSTAPEVLAAVALWLALASALAPPDRQTLRTGLVLTALLAGGALVFGLLGGIGVGLTLRRTSRAALLVLVATWLRGAAGAEGLREVFRRILTRLRRLPSVAEAARVLDHLGSDQRLLAAARALARAVESVPKRPVPVLDAVLRWVARESVEYRSVPPALAPPLRARALDWAVLLLAVAPGFALAAS